MAAENEKRETLEEFSERFGSLSDRAAKAANPNINMEEKPRAEIQGRTEAKEQDNNPQGHEDPYEFLPEESVQGTFEDAAQNKASDDKQQGRGSKMVEKDQPENNMPPPENSEAQDRQTHNAEMREDDYQSRSPFSDEYLDKMNRKLDEKYEDYDQDQDRGYDHQQGDEGHSRDYGQG